MSIYISRGNKFTRTVYLEVTDIPLEGRFVGATFDVDVEHDPGQTYGASPCYYDSPADPAGNRVSAVRVREWTEYDASGNELPKVCTDSQVVAAAMPRIEEQTYDLYC